MFVLGKDLCMDDSGANDANYLPVIIWQNTNIVLWTFTKFSQN